MGSLEAWGVAEGDWTSFGKQSSSIYFLVAPHGGIRPAERRRSRLALTLAEREDLTSDRSNALPAIMSTRGRACRSHEISGNSRLAPGRIANANIRRPPSADAPGLAFRRGSSPPVEPRRNGTPSFDALELGS
jgi:hypothetical protein